MDRPLEEMLAMMQREVGKWMKAILRDVFDPDAMADFMRSAGMDADQLADMSGQAGFDPYRVLGLDRSAPDEEVKARYRQLLHKLHPDTAGAPGTEFLLGLVVEAYRRISEERGWS